MALTVEPQYLAISHSVSSERFGRTMTLGRSGSGSTGSPARMPATMVMGDRHTLASPSSSLAPTAQPLPSFRSPVPPRSQVQGMV